MPGDALGIHHVTMVAGEPARCADFYARVLGLRLVKRTVNFDDPGTHHLYFGDRLGSPGTILTFFPYPGARPGRQGAGQAVGVALAVPRASLAFWLDRLHRLQVPQDGPGERFGERALRLRDPDGLRLELVGVDAAAAEGAAHATGEVAAGDAVIGVHGVTLAVAEPERTAAVLEAGLGFAPAGRDGERSRSAAPGGAPFGRFVDLLRPGPGDARGSPGAGTVHHVAFRAADDAAQAEVRAAVAGLGQDPTPVLDRNYFRSIYFREPGGVLFEVATDPPGFAVDEPVERLGEGLMLPARYEPRRAEIERALPALAASDRRAFGAAP